MILLTFSVILATVVCIGFTYFWVQFAELYKTKAAMMEIREEVLRISSTLSLEIEEVRKLKEELLLTHVTHVGVDREKRSALLGKRGNLGSNKTKDIFKLSKERKSSSKSSAHNHRTSHSFHGIFKFFGPRCMPDALLHDYLPCSHFLLRMHPYLPSVIFCECLHFIY